MAYAAVRRAPSIIRRRRSPAPPAIRIIPSSIGRVVGPVLGSWFTEALVTAGALTLTGGDAVAGVPALDLVLAAVTTSCAVPGLEVTAFTAPVLAPVVECPAGWVGFDPVCPAASAGR